MSSPQSFCWNPCSSSFKFSVLCFCCVCLRSVSFMPNVALVSLDCPFLLTLRLFLPLIVNALTWIPINNLTHIKRSQTCWHDIEEHWQLHGINWPTMSIKRSLELMFIVYICPTYNKTFCICILSIKDSVFSNVYLHIYWYLSILYWYSLHQKSEIHVHRVYTNVLI